MTCPSGEVVITRVHTTAVTAVDHRTRVPRTA